MKKVALTALKIIVSAALIGWALKGLDWNKLAELWSEAELAWLLLSLTLLTVSYIMGAWQWNRILNIAEIPLTFSKTLAYYYIGLFFNNFLLSGMGGDLVRVYDAQKHATDPQRLSPALASVFLDRLTGLMALIFLASVSGMFLIGRGESMKMFAAILALFFGWVIGFFILFNRRAAERLIKPVLKFLPARIYDRLEHLYSAVNRFKESRSDLIRIFLIAVTVQLLRICSIWAIGHALGDKSDFLFYVLFVPLISLAASLPISIGGTGPREQTTVFLFRRIGVGPELAFSVGFVTYIMSAISTVPGAILFMIRKTET